MRELAKNGSIKDIEDLIKSLEKTPDESAKAILYWKSILTEKLTKMREKKLRLLIIYIYNQKNLLDHI